MQQRPVFNPPMYGSLRGNENQQLETYQDDSRIYVRLLMSGKIILNPERRNNVVLMSLATGDIFMRTLNYKSTSLLFKLTDLTAAKYQRYATVAEGFKQLQKTNVGRFHVFNLKEFNEKCDRFNLMNIPAPEIATEFPEIATVRSQDFHSDQ